MKVKQIFELGLKMGIEADPRGVKGVKEYLAQTKKEHAELKPKDKKYFDKSTLTNPYNDSAIHVDDGKTQVKRAMVGIDIAEEEILLASQLNERRKKIDLVISHHPCGKSLADLHSTMDMLTDVYEGIGMPVHVAEKVNEERMKEVGRGVHPINHYKITDIANLLQINLINTHTFTDNIVQKFLTEYLAKKKPKTISQLVDCLLEIPEYQEAKKRGAGPNIYAGDPKRRVGKYFVDMTGGTSPSEKIYKEFSTYGISTIVGMHLHEDSTKNASKQNINVVVAGHIASDSLGMNLFLDELEKKGIEIVPCGGLIRVKR
ncbi:MAG: NGG1p interacting factor NIF3 [Parcubacteria group bacterium]|nr:NGG1p interacting factor NIF3 [Parcubacteria group bacterium]